jgi:hypothetical protein
MPPKKTEMYECVEAFVTNDGILRPGRGSSTRTTRSWGRRDLFDPAQNFRQARRGAHPRFCAPGSSARLTSKRDKPIGRPPRRLVRSERGEVLRRFRSLQTRSRRDGVPTGKHRRALAPLLSRDQDIDWSERPRPTTCGSLRGDSNKLSGILDELVVDGASRRTTTGS